MGNMYEFSAISYFRDTWQIHYVKQLQWDQNEIDFFEDPQLMPRKGRIVYARTTFLAFLATAREG